MSEQGKNKPGQPNELDLIKSALSADLDETTVDIFSGDLFGKSEPEKKKQAETEKQKPAEPWGKSAGPELKPVEAEEIKLSLQEEAKQEPEMAQKPEAVAGEKVDAELSWEKPPAQKVQAPAPVPKKPPVLKTPSVKPKPEIETELKIEAGEFHSVAAVKDEEKLDQTGEILQQLEKMGDDFLSADEMKKLFQNVNLMIELLNKTLSRIEQLERKLREKGIL